MKLYHLDWQKSSERDEARHFSLITGIGDATANVLAAFHEGLYDHVADADGDDLDRLYMATENGVVSPSWSRMPPEGVMPTEPSFHVGGDGKRYGRRSTAVGDVVELDGRLHVVAKLGFTDIGAASRVAATAPA